MTEKENREKKSSSLTRRDFLKYASASAGITAASLALSGSVSSALSTTNPSPSEQFLHTHPSGVSVARQVEGGMDPMEFLTDFYKGSYDSVARERVFDLISVPQSITVARGVEFPAWIFTSSSRNGLTVPGPTLWAKEGDKMLINFINGDNHPHTIHLHGIHPALADGVFEVRNAGDPSFPYEFTAEPFGLYLYHCHVMPVKKHIAKGLYGAFIVDPVDSAGQPIREPAKELVMVMNGFDVDFDDGNEFYTVNGIPNYYLDNPIEIRVGELVRIYLVNLTEFDPVNSFHLHGNMFRLYRTGTRFEPTKRYDSTSGTLDQRVRQWLQGSASDNTAEVTDVVFLGQGERAILEFVPKHTGRFLFHAHQSEFIELGWAGLFKVIE